MFRTGLSLRNISPMPQLPVRDRGKEGVICTLQLDCMQLLLNLQFHFRTCGTKVVL